MGALFAAGDALEWLASGAQSVDWWPVDMATASCTDNAEAMFTSTGVPTTPYYGYLLASQLAQPNAQLSSLTTSDPADVLAFQSVLPNGQTAVALINTNTSTAETVTVGTSLTGGLSTESYSAGNQNAANTKTVSGTTTASAIAGGITLPAESIVVLKTLKPSAMALAATASSYKAGTKVTLKGKLTLDGAAAPAGVTVKITRQLSGSKADSATLTAKTVAGGTFTVTNVPPATGTYVYDASYTSSGYAARYALGHGEGHRRQADPQAGGLGQVGQAGPEGDGDRHPGGAARQPDADHLRAAQGRREEGDQARRHQLQGPAHPSSTPSRRTPPSP